MLALQPEGSILLPSLILLPLGTHTMICPVQVCRIQIWRTRDPVARSPGFPSPSALALRQVFWEILQARLAELLHAISCEAFGVEALPSLLGLAAGEIEEGCPSCPAGR